MSKFNTKKTGFDTGIIAGAETKTAGKYTDYELLRRITLSNMLFESNYYQPADKIMNQIEKLVKIVDPQLVIDLAIECRFEQKLRHTPLWLLLLVNEYHKGHSIAAALTKISTRPDMLMDMLAIMKAKYGTFKPIPKPIKKGLKKAFDNYNGYQLSKYKKSNLEISLIDFINLVNHKPINKNRESLTGQVNGTLAV